MSTAPYKIYRRPESDIYHVRGTVNGRRIRKSTETADKKLATEFAAKLFASAYRVEKLGDKQAHTLSALIVDWTTRYTEESRRSLADMQAKWKFWLEKLGRDRDIKTITRGEVDKIMVAYKRSQRKLSFATMNRYVAEVSKLLNHACKIEWLDASPSFIKYEESAKKHWELTPELEARLFASLPPYKARMMRFALACGLREANVRLLLKENVDIARKLAIVEAETTKGKRSFPVPLSTEALEVLAQEYERHPTSPYVFCKDDGEPRSAGSSDETWYETLEEIGLYRLKNDGSKEWFRWHDLRHTWAVRHRKNGTPSSVLQRLGGWATPAMVDRYAHLDDDFMKQYADNSRAPEQPKA